MRRNAISRGRWPRQAALVLTALLAVLGLALTSAFADESGAGDAEESPHDTPGVTADEEEAPDAEDEVSEEKQDEEEASDESAGAGQEPDTSDAEDAPPTSDQETSPADEPTPDTTDTATTDPTETTAADSGADDESATPDQDTAAADPTDDTKQSEDDGAEATLLYEEAVLLYQEQRFAEAGEKLVRGFELDPDPVLAYNAARAFDDAGRLDDARRWYLKSLELEGLASDLRSRATNALERIANTESTIKARVESLEPTESRLRVTATQDAARVVVNGEVVGETPFSQVMPPGTYTIEVDADGHEPYAETVELEAGQTVLVRAALQTESLLPWVWVMTGVGVAAVGVGIAGDVLAVDRYDRAEAARGDRDAFDAFKNEGEAFQIMAIAGYSTAGAAAITGVVLLLVDVTSGGGEYQYRTLGAAGEPRWTISPTEHGASIGIVW